jgi:DNA-binding protein HU-beta
MPIGKDSITKRVAKQSTEEKIAPELVATTAAAPKAPAKKTSTASTTKKTNSPANKTTSAAKKTTTSTAKRTAPKTKVKKETLTPPTEEKKVDTAVLANVSPETVAAVIGHKEDEKYEKVQIGQKMPSFLL